MALKPALHARDHAPGGADPLTITPGALQYASITANNQSLGTSLTAVEFNSIGGSFDSDTPIFDLDNGDLLIGGPGFYSFYVTSSGWVLNTNKVTVLIAQLAVTGGSNGLWSGAYVGSVGFVDARKLLRFDNSTDDYTLTNLPDVFSYAAWATGDTFPVTLQLKAYIEEDEVGTATSDGDFRLWAVRHGDLYA